MQDKCAQALLCLYKKARQVQPRHDIAGNKRVVSINLTTRKQQKLLQTEQSRSTFYVIFMFAQRGLF